ncbi:prolipoprotein diacylglyceryl transferase family protein [Spiroplasma alleghenense]|nr:prolipoprotein diacylglyceryl transferase family protein [Spiroplasma alleghenense]
MINFLSNIPNPGDQVDKWLEQGQNDPYLWGWMPIYPIFIFLGVMAVLIASVIKFRMRKIPLYDLGIGIFVVIPAGIIGASVLGKFNIIYNNWKVWELFYFWQPGMSIFGGLIFGGAAGFAWFHKRAQHYQISTWVYSDCILPNVLLGQAIGRWGNLYNHEILGKPTSLESLQKWLPDWIVNKLWYVQNPNPGALETDPWFIEYREPLFLYESIACLLLFVLITFLIANLGRLFSKKPWKIYPQEFPNNFNKQLKWAKKEELQLWETQRAIVYKERINNEVSELKLSWWESWNKAYYLKVLDNERIAYFSELENIEQSNLKRKELKLEKSLQLQKNELDSNKQSYLKKLKKVKTSTEKKELEKKYKLKVREIKQSYRQQIKELKRETNWFRNTWNQDCKDLYQANNPDNYFVIHCGVVSSSYLVGYMIIRWVLETRRTDAELVLKHLFAMDMVLFAILTTFSLVLLVFAQFISPYKWRKINWLYEKSY